MGRPRIYRSVASKQAAYRQRLKRRARGITHGVDEWTTPPELFAELHREFRFTLDAAAHPHNAKVRRYYTPEQDALQQTWRGRVWCNPPYGRVIPQWLDKARQSAQDGATVVMLLPASTDASWFHDLILPHAEYRFLRGRLKFSGHSDCAAFGSMLAIFRPARRA